MCYASILFIVVFYSIIFRTQLSRWKFSSWFCKLNFLQKYGLYTCFSSFMTHFWPGATFTPERLKQQSEKFEQLS